MTWRTHGVCAILACTSAAGWLACVGDDPGGGTSAPDAGPGMPSPDGGGGGGDDGGDAATPPCILGDASYAFCDTFDGVPLGAAFVPPWSELSHNGPATFTRDDAISRSPGMSAVFRSPAGEAGTSETFARLVKTFVGPRRRAAMRFAVRVLADAYPGNGNYYAALGHFGLLFGATPGYIIVNVVKRVGPGAATPYVVRGAVYVGNQSIAELAVEEIQAETWTTIELAVDFVDKSASISVDDTKVMLPGLPAEVTSSPAVKMHLGGAVTGPVSGFAAWQIHYDDVGLTFVP